MAQSIKIGDKVNVGGSFKTVTGVAAAPNAKTKGNDVNISTASSSILPNDSRVVLSHVTPDGKATYIVG